MTPGRPSRGELPRPTGMAALAVVWSHPLRVRIVTAMNSPERIRSPNELAEEMGVPVDKLAYHMRELRDLGFVALVDERTVRGTVEHFYSPTKRLEAWEAEWRSLPSATKRIFAASTLRWAVESIGAAIDTGTFEARDDSALGQDTFWTDERGAREALAILHKTLADLMVTADAAKARLEVSGEEGFLISYVLSGFEGALRPVGPDGSDDDTVSS